MERDKFDEDNISVSSGLPSGSFTFDDACSDDTDFLIAQNLSLRELNDERSSTTTDLLYQSSLIQFVDEEREPSHLRDLYSVNGVHEKLDLKSTAELISGPVQNHAYSLEGGDTLSGNNDSVSVEVGLNSSVIDKFSKLQISSPNLYKLGASKSLHSAWRSDNERINERVVIVPANEKEQFLDSQQSLTIVTELSKPDDLSYSTIKNIAANRSNGSKDSSKLSSGISSFSVTEQKKNTSKEDSWSLRERSNEGRDLNVVDEKVEEGQRIIAQLFGKVEQDEKKAQESRLRRVKQWTLVGHESPTEERSISASNIHDVSSEQKENSTGLTASWHRSPDNQSGKISNSPDGRKSNYTTSSRGASPKVDVANCSQESFSGARAMHYLTDSGHVSKSPPIHRSSTPESSHERRATANSFDNRKNLPSPEIDSILPQSNNVDHLNWQKQDLIAEITEAMETLRSLQGDVQSLDQLAEQHRKQTVAARSELLAIERQRDEAQLTLDNLNEQVKDKRRISSSAELEKLMQEKEDIEKKYSKLLDKSKLSESSEMELSIMKQKIQNLQDHLGREEQRARETISALNKQLEEERSKVREMQIGKMDAIRNLREELQDLSETEKRDITERLRKEKVAEIEIVEAKFKRELNKITIQLKERDSKIQTLQEDLGLAETSYKEYKDRLYELEMKSLLKNEQLEQISASLDGTKGQLEKELASAKHRETLLQDKIKEITREHRSSKDQLIQMEKSLENEKSLREQQLKQKDTELDSLQKVVSKNEESSRAFGERMRKEAKDMVQTALSEERDNHSQEITDMKYKLEQMTVEKESLVQTHNRELQMRNEDIQSLQKTVDKLRKEIDEQKKLSFEAQEQKVLAINSTRTELKEEIGRLKEKLREMEKKDKSVALEIAEECMKIAVVTGSSSPMKKSSWLISPEKTSSGNAGTEAVKILKQHLDDLKVHCMTLKRECDSVKEDFIDQDFDSGNQNSNGMLKEKDETIAKLQRQIQEMERRFQNEREVQENRHKETLENVEREIKNLSRNGNEVAMASTPKSAERISVYANGSTEESSTSKLLRHLQGRVKQLRAQNLSLKYSDDDSYSSELDSTTSFTMQELTAEPPSPIGTNISHLEQALKKAEDYGRRNAALLNQKMSEMTKLQRMLTHASKENMKLERAHASLQQRLAEIIGKPK